MSARWALFIDVAKCHNCRNCYVACKDEHVDNDWPGVSAPQPRHGHEWIAIATRERGEAPMVDVAHLPTMCNQCENAPCVAAAGDGAVYRRDDGIVIIDPVRARGRREIVDSCPYGAIAWNDELQLAQKWTFDAHLIDRGWKEPRCVQVCPTGAMTSAKLDDAALARKLADEEYEPLRPELGARPRVFYRHLARYTKVFVGATLVRAVNGVVECVAGARAAVVADGREIAQAVSDDFGEVKVDGLDEGRGRVRFVVEQAGFRRIEIDVDLGESRYLGTLALEPG
ncbi:MAG: 4Fe-4S dicluster domain-containing protein [Burkholderiales bacterium]